MARVTRVGGVLRTLMGSRHSCPRVPAAATAVPLEDPTLLLATCETLRYFFYSRLFFFSLKRIGTEKISDKKFNAHSDSDRRHRWT